jgi:type III secretory pathway component EscT
VAILARGIEVAVAIAAPIVVVSVVVEVGSALVARAAAPAFVQPLLAPLRSVAILAVLAVVFERVVELLVVVAGRAG